ncbi:MAG: radical SAM protein, partial [Halobacteriota archaeon]
MSFDVVRPFDPWRSELCTCPPKYSFNPYTGCAHGCLYCYATYIPHFHNLRMKKDLLK